MPGGATVSLHDASSMNNPVIAHCAFSLVHVPDMVRHGFSILNRHGIAATEETATGGAPAEIIRLVSG